MTSGSGELIADPTMGNAFQTLRLGGGWIEKFRRVASPSFRCSRSAWPQFFSRSASGFNCPSAARHESDFVAKVLKHIESRANIRQRCNTPAAFRAAGDLLATAIRHVDEKEYIEVLYERCSALARSWSAGCPFLALVATTGPLLGLLGTVTGMIATFKIISSFGGSDPKMLAAGISRRSSARPPAWRLRFPRCSSSTHFSRAAPRGIIGSMEQIAVGFGTACPTGGGFPGR